MIKETENTIFKSLQHDSIFRVGEVVEVKATKIKIKVSKGKNLSYLMYKGNIVKNVGVGSYIEIKKDYLSYIGKIYGEETNELPQDKRNLKSINFKNTDQNLRFLNVQLFGYIDNVINNIKFCSGVNDLPLIGNEAFVVTEKLTSVIHNLAKDNELHINIAKTQDDQIINLPLERIFNSHIAIFGNTGSGKSNTLASLLHHLFTQIESHPGKTYFNENSSFLIFDYNGEYSNNICLTKNKTVHEISNHPNDNRRIPVDSNFIDVETLSILSDATDITQKPFLKRMYENFNDVDDSVIIENLTESYEKLLKIKDRDKANRIKNLFDELLSKKYYKKIHCYLTWNQYAYWDICDKDGTVIASQGTQIKYSSDFNIENKNTNIFKSIINFNSDDGIIGTYINLCYIQLIQENCGGFNQHDFVLPVIYRLKSRKDEIQNIFSIKEKEEHSNIEIFNLHNASSEMKKITSLLLVKKRYEMHLQTTDSKKALFIIIDEAHTVLSKVSKRESDMWKDYRLDVFEEIVKEGRKFGVFLALSSQRPSDISETIISQIHNFFIHRLVNEQDLKMISQAVTYIDDLTRDEISILPTGTCIFSGIASNFPIKLVITPLPPIQQPQSQTLKICSLFNVKE